MAAKSHRPVGTGIRKYQDLTERRRRAPRHIALVSFTDQGIRDIKNSAPILERSSPISSRQSDGRRGSQGSGPTLGLSPATETIPSEQP